jgi:hypothetical protein
MVAALTPSAVGAVAPHRAVLPVLLVLPPLLVGPPWDDLVARAAATLQEPQFARVLPASSTRATLEQALACQDVRSVVVADEGPGSPIGASSIGVRTRAVAHAVAALPAGRRRRPTVGALWFDTVAGDWHGFVFDEQQQRLVRLPVAWQLLDGADNDHQGDGGRRRAAP